MSEHDGDAPAGADKRGWSALFNLLMLVVGGVALAWMLRTTSWHELRNVLSGVGIWAAVILVVELGGLVCDAAALHAFMRPEARMVSFLRVLGAQASGRAINVLTPLGALGEATKVTMLEGHAPRSRVLSSIVLHNVAVLYLNVTIMLIGIPITLLLVDLPHSVKLMIGGGLAVLVPAMIALAVMIHRGAASSAVGLLRTSRLISAERATAWRAKLVDVDGHIRELHKHRTAGTRVGLVFVLISKLLSATSTTLIMLAVGVELDAALVIAVQSVGVLITWISSVVPLGLGLADGGNYAMYSMLGAGGEHGMFVTMLGRARSVAIAVLGLGAMAGINAHSRYARWRLHRKLQRLRAARAD
ncbi:MAG: flippase-like domain-containing protein [Myxococcales bacterium]|nr:flippase-like domain-containing protein [Myxococcales bacterium]